MAPGREEISSSLTFLYKAVIPAIWSLAWPIAVLVVWSNDSATSGGDFVWAAAAFVWSPVWIAGIIFMYWRLAPLKRVWIDERSVYVSNFLREDAVPFGAIVEVSERRILSPSMATIRFQSPTAF